MYQLMIETQKYLSLHLLLPKQTNKKDKSYSTRDDQSHSIGVQV